MAERASISSSCSPASPMNRQRQSTNVERGQHYVGTLRSMALTPAPAPLDLFAACQAGDLAQIKFIVECAVSFNPDVFCGSEEPSRRHKTALFIAIEHSHLLIVRYLVESCKANPNIGRRVVDHLEERTTEDGASMCCIIFVSRISSTTLSTLK